MLCRRVAWSLLRTPWLLELISSANVVPLESWRAEHQSESCTLKLPDMMALLELRRGEMEGLKVLGQLCTFWRDVYVCYCDAGDLYGGVLNERVV